MIQNVNQELLHLKVARNGQKRAYIKVSLPFKASLKGCNSRHMQGITMALIRFLTSIQ